MKQHSIADLYSDYLLASFGATTATGLSQLLEGEVSHDQVTRYLAGTKKTAADLWRTVKAFVRQVQSEAGVLIIDDSIEEKPYTDENDLVCWHYDHSKDRMLKVINFLTALYSSQGGSLPVGFHLVAKTEKYVDPKTQQEKRRSPVSKNTVCQEQIKQAVTNRIPFRFVLFDVWFASTETLMFIKQEQHRDFLCPLKTNRKVALSGPSQKIWNKGSESGIRSLAGGGKDADETANRHTHQRGTKSGRGLGQSRGKECAGDSPSTDGTVVRRRTQRA